MATDALNNRILLGKNDNLIDIGDSGSYRDEDGVLVVRLGSCGMRLSK